MGYRDQMILTCIPWADDANLGRAYNEVMESLPDNGWAVLMDHDAMFTTSLWHGQVEMAIQRQPHGTFTGRTNRAGKTGDRKGWQRVASVDPNEHDIRTHREIGERLAVDDTLRDVTDEFKLMAGVLMAVSRETWGAVGGFKDGWRGVDYAFHLSIRASGRRLFCIDGLYVYHWKRGDGSTAPKGLPICNWRQMLDPSDPDYMRRYLIH